MSLFNTNQNVSFGRIVKSFFISMALPIFVAWLFWFVTHLIFPPLWEGERDSIGWNTDPGSWIIYFGFMFYYLVPFPFAVPIVMTFLIATNWDRIRHRLLTHNSPSVPSVPKPPVREQEQKQ